MAECRHAPNLDSLYHGTPVPAPPACTENGNVDSSTTNGADRPDRFSGRTHYSGPSNKDNPPKPVVPGTPTPPALLKEVKLKLHPGGEKVEPAVFLIGGVVARDGSFIDIHIIKSSNMKFSEDALATVRQYRFKPATLDGTPIAVDLNVVFSLGTRGFFTKKQAPSIDSVPDPAPTPTATPVAVPSPSPAP